MSAIKEIDMSKISGGMKDAIKKHGQILANRRKFQETLQRHYEVLFKESPDFFAIAQKTTPELLATRMTKALYNRDGNKEGEGIKRTCKELGLKHTYKEIEAFLCG